MLRLKCADVPDKFTAYCVSKANIDPTELHLIPSGREHVITSDHAMQISKSTSQYANLTIYQGEKYFDASVDECYDEKALYDDVIIFVKNRSKNVFTFKGESDDESFKVPLFHCPNNDYWYSYVPFQNVKVTKHIKLSIDNLCHIMGLPPFTLDNLLTWQKVYKISINFRSVDFSKNYQNQLQNQSIPGQVKLENPIMSIDIGVEKFPFDYCYMFNFKQPARCSKPDCYFKTQRKDRMARHEEQCASETKIVAKQQFYGKEDTTFDNWSISSSFFTNPSFKFATFDIETYEMESPLAEAKLVILSIGLTTNMGDRSFYFERKSSSAEHGQEMVNDFMDKLEEMATFYLSEIGPEIDEELEKIEVTCPHVTYMSYHICSHINI